MIIVDDKYRQKLVQLLMKTIMYGWSYVVKKLGNEIVARARGLDRDEIRFKTWIASCARKDGHYDDTEGRLREERSDNGVTWQSRG